MGFHELLPSFNDFLVLTLFFHVKLRSCCSHRALWHTLVQFFLLKILGVFSIYLTSWRLQSCATAKLLTIKAILILSISFEFVILTSSRRENLDLRLGRLSVLRINFSPWKEILESELLLFSIWSELVEGSFCLSVVVGGVKNFLKIYFFLDLLIVLIHNGLQLINLGLVVIMYASKLFLKLLLV